MLFNSPSFIFGFLPIVLAGFFFLGRYASPRLAIVWLGFASLVFYGFDNPKLQLPLILVSIAFNFLTALALARKRDRRILVTGVVGNLLLLGLFKYADLLTDTAAMALNLPLTQPNIPLPIGISFYTFTQIAFLVDTYRSGTKEYSPAKYLLFVTFFPHLIAGPILHHSETIPQFDRKETFRPQARCLALGLGWFAIGLAKKVLLADSIAPFANAVFDAVAKGESISSADAWIGTLCYTLQLYFDFSGYSDMAIGLALLFGITFPLNFNSPYKATSIIDFWRRWHMTLSRFLRDYLYIPLGGNRRGPVRHRFNLFATMLIGGIWHGASWNFAAWGAIHGIALVTNHLWQRFAFRHAIALPPAIGLCLTLLVVVLAWVPFRADTFSSTFVIWKAMLWPSEWLGAVNQIVAVPYIVALGALALFGRNTQEIMSHPWEPSQISANWAPRPAWAIALGCLFGVAVAGVFNRETVFLYFRF